MAGMDLKTYWAPLTADQRELFASRCLTSKGHLQNVMYGVRPCATDLAVAIERESGCSVTRQELRPDDWESHWPELIKPPATNDGNGALHGPVVHTFHQMMQTSVSAGHGSKRRADHRAADALRAAEALELEERRQRDLAIQFEDRRSPAEIKNRES
jgi:DNA-binding transcriptional regulator YdaS (Cro superfamily)